MTAKEVFNKLAVQGIFLPKNQVLKLTDEINLAFEKTQSSGIIFKILDEAFKRKEFQKYRDEGKGAWAFKNKREESKKKVLQFNIESGEVIAVHASLYDATKAINKPKSFNSNIRKAANKNSHALGFAWKWKEANND